MNRNLYCRAFVEDVDQSIGLVQGNGLDGHLSGVGFEQAVPVGLSPLHLVPELEYIPELRSTEHPAALSGHTSQLFIDWILDREYWLEVVLAFLLGLRFVVVHLEDIKGSRGIQRLLLGL